MNMRIKERNVLQVVNQNCAGIDVHKDFVCVTTLCGPDGAISSEYQVFQSTNRELIRLRQWLLSKNIYVAGAESTGKYWFPLLNAFGDQVKLQIYNARHIKNLPGKKTDKSDSEWIAGVTRHAMLLSSFIPEKLILESRLLARTRKSLVQRRTSVRQEIHGTLECGSIKISGVITDVFGYTGTNLLKLLISGRPINETVVKKCLHCSMIKKLDRIMEALDGYLSDKHRFIIKLLMSEQDILTERIELIEKKLYSLLVNTPEHLLTMQKLTVIPGMTERSAILVLSEIGFDLSSFSKSDKFCNWVGVAPGKHESAGKNKSGRIQIRQCYIRSLLTEIAFASVRCKGTFFQAKFLSLKRRMSTKKAVVAIAHKIAKVIYAVIHDGKEYSELGADYFFIRDQDHDYKLLARITNRLGKKAVLEQLNEIPDPT